MRNKDLMTELKLQEYSCPTGKKTHICLGEFPQTPNQDYYIIRQKDLGKFLKLYQSRSYFDKTDVPYIHFTGGNTPDTDIIKTI